MSRQRLGLRVLLHRFAGRAHPRTTAVNRNALRTLSGALQFPSHPTPLRRSGSSRCARRRFRRRGSTALLGLVAPPSWKNKKAGVWMTHFLSKRPPVPTQFRDNLVETQTGVSTSIAPSRHNLTNFLAHWSRRNLGATQKKEKVSADPTRRFLSENWSRQRQKKRGHAPAARWV